MTNLLIYLKKTLKAIAYDVEGLQVDDPSNDLEQDFYKHTIEEILYELDSCINKIDKAEDKANLLDYMAQIKKDTQCKTVTTALKRYQKN